ncbi:alpha/beta hydrolase [Demequina capsici]|uniref:Alpha/beta hydrolase n=1 Tax=Demequina capsici TaxID=3075620 RepID=A0AA96J915_9MICO|nr:alpha/beta hydrolase [Demequina sp. OYTSA14]WNM25905.1 alpha/beta hydrolase [Demequina sp. OYTSA14]
MTTPSPGAALAWREDVLPGFEQAPLGAATLVRALARPARPRGVVLHVHGYNDYFFQEHLAEHLVSQGYAFYAVDLRRAGRSLRQDDVPHLMHDVDEPGEDIALAAEAVAHLEPTVPLALHAHSTGGLTALLRLHRHGPGHVQALVLDSPFLGAPSSWRMRLGARSLPVIARTRPLSIVSSGPSWYATHLHAQNGGRWQFDTAWKRPDGLPVRAAWLAAVLKAQRQVAAGLQLAIPVLVARAAEGGHDSPDNPRLDSQDTVVDVDAISRLAPQLGADVSLLVVPDGVHDLTLSAPAPRDMYLGGVTGWLAHALPSRGGDDA